MRYGSGSGVADAGQSAGVSGLGTERSCAPTAVSPRAYGPAARIDEAVPGPGSDKGSQRRDLTGPVQPRRPNSKCTRCCPQRG